MDFEGRRGRSAGGRGGHARETSLQGRRQLRGGAHVPLAFWMQRQLQVRSNETGRENSEREFAAAPAARVARRPAAAASCTASPASALTFFTSPSLMSESAASLSLPL